MTIGERAVQEIRRHAGTPNVRNIRKELAKLDIPDSSYRGWRNGETSPSAFYLAKMAIAGYDVLWILTGEKREDEQ